MLEKLNERIKDRDVSLGVVIVVSGGSLMWSVDALAGLCLVVYGLIQMFWVKEEKFIEEHHHHHHHNNKPRKKAPRKKNA